MDIKIITDFTTMSKYSSFAIVTELSNIESEKNSIERWTQQDGTLLFTDKDKNPVVTFYEVDQDEINILQDIYEITLALTDPNGSIIEAYKVEKLELKNDLN